MNCKQAFLYLTAKIQYILLLIFMSELKVLDLTLWQLRVFGRAQKVRCSFTPNNLPSARSHRCEKCQSALISFIRELTSTEFKFVSQSHNSTWCRILDDRNDRLGVYEKHELRSARW